MKEVQAKNEIIRKPKGANLVDVYKEDNSIYDFRLKHPLFTDKAFADMTLKKIPDFEIFYRRLIEIQWPKGRDFSVLNYLPVLRQFSLTDKLEIKRFLNNPESNHVLVQNENLKIVLIRWESGMQSKIHGHALGGCIFKVLYGEIEEKRYASDNENLLFSESKYQIGNVAFIHNILGYHSVGNSTNEPAITLHIYTTGN